jgi:hypothetical protein
MPDMIYLEVIVCDMSAYWSHWPVYAVHPEGWWTELTVQLRIWNVRWSGDFLTLIKHEPAVTGRAQYKRVISAVFCEKHSFFSQYLGINVINT